MRASAAFRNAIFPLAVLLLSSGGAAAQSSAPRDTAEHWTDGALRRELITMGGQDQAIRASLTGEKMQDTAFMLRMLREDSARTRRMREILRTKGWPGRSMVGREGAEAAWLIVQHSDSPEFQAEALRAIDAAAPGEVEPQARALLVDRVRTKQGKPQLYGSQFDVRGGRLVAFPIEDEAHLDERRAAVGLPPMADYVRMMGEMYKMPVDLHPPTP
jgi:hypothetical protein